jgi:hypothetical protein
VSGVEINEKDFSFPFGIIMRKIFLSLLGLAIIPFLTTEIFATHYSEHGIDDLWYWREWDSFGTGDAPDCKFIEVDGGGARLEVMVNDLGVAHRGQCINLKTFDIADIRNVGGSNTFSLRYTGNCDSGCFYIWMGVVDGNYEDWYDDNSPGSIWPENAGETVEFEWATRDPGSWGDLNNPTATNNMDCDFTNPNGATNTMSCTITDAEWDRALTGEVTLVWGIGRQSTTSGTNFWVQPLWITIDNTPVNGTLTWDFPEIASEVTMWEDYGVDVLQLNGTNQDYGYYSTVNPSIPDPPTNLVQETVLGDIELEWIAPVFNGILYRKQY